jgi:integrase
MTVHFYLERKQLKGDEKTIYCYVRGLQNGKTLILNTKQKINPYFWDKEQEKATDRGRTKYRGARELNDLLESYKEEVKRTIRILLANNPTESFESIKSKILERFGRTVKIELSFFEALDEFIRIRSNDLSENTLRKFKTIRVQLNDFEKSTGKKLLFANIDLNFYDNFLTYLFDTRMLINNSAYKVIGLLKMFLKWAYERGYNKNETFRKFKLKEEKVDIIALTDSELEKLIKLDLALSERTEKVRDVFVFGCYTGGRFSDLSKIEWTDIKNGVWYLRVIKTKEILEIPLIKPAQLITNKYKENKYPLPRISNQKLNKYIKEVCQLAGINDKIKIVKYRRNVPIETIKPKYELVTIHSARRTFVTQCLLRGMKAEVVMSISGHKNFKIFRQYLDITRKDKESELNKAWNKDSNSAVK